MNAPPLPAAAHPPATRRLLRVGGLAGMLMYPVFTVTVLVLTWLKWDFLRGLGWTVLDAHNVNYPSSLARGDFGVVQSLNFLVVLSLLCLLFTRALRTRFVHRASGSVATAALAVVVLSGALSAFPTDLPGEAASWHGALHGLGFLCLMVGNVIAFTTTGLALRGAPDWAGFWVYSIVNAPAAALMLFLPLGQPAFYAAVTVMLAWYAIMGARLYRLAGKSET
jgi:hypothetical protein